MLDEGFLEKYKKLSKEKNSYLCVGIDPALPSIRGKLVIPSYLIEKNGVKKGIKNYCLQIIQAVAPFTPIIKPNKQYLINPLDYEDVKEIVNDFRTRHVSRRTIGNW